jgi:hypothetical protein
MATQPSADEIRQNFAVYAEKSSLITDWNSILYRSVPDVGPSEIELFGKYLGISLEGSEELKKLAVNPPFDLYSGG